MVDVVVSGALGAAILAIALLTYGWRKNRRDITRLQAEITATKIAALTQMPADPAPTTAPANEEEPAPARRRKHLSLHLGGCAAGILVAVAETIRRTLGGNRPAAAALSMASVAVTGAGTLFLTPHVMDAPTPRGSPPATSTPGEVSGARTGEDIANTGSSLMEEDHHPASPAPTDSGLAVESTPGGRQPQTPPAADRAAPSGSASTAPGPQARSGTPFGETDNKPGNGLGRDNGGGDGNGRGNPNANGHGDRHGHGHGHGQGNGHGQGHGNRHDHGHGNGHLNRHDHSHGNDPESGDSYGTDPESDDSCIDAEMAC